MDEHGKRRNRGDATFTLGDDVLARLDGYRRELEAQHPGVRISRSSAVRSILIAALCGDGNKAA